MSEQLKTIRLYGELGRRFGRQHRLAVRNTNEAIRALSAMQPGFEAFLIQAKDRGMTFSVFAGKDNLKKEELDRPVGSDDIRIAPIISGSKRAGLFQTILGVALIVGASIVTGGAASAAFGWSAALASGGMTGAIAMMGVSMMIGGVAQMLAPTPQGLGTSDRPENRPSYTFNGPVNTQAQGNPVPVLYGRLVVGSAVISASIRAEGMWAPYDPCYRYNPNRKMSMVSKVMTEALCKAEQQKYEDLRDDALANADPDTGSRMTSARGGGGSIRWTNDEQDHLPV